ncbi:response regulator receiver domain protein [Fusobacterium sp. CM1]|nr:response regulator receiver domain protein [Fusobacterium sp. CM1]
MYKLMIADDEPLIRRGIKQLIDLSSLQIGEIHEASTGEEALKVFEEFRPEIVLMDINMPKIDGLSVAKKIKLINPDTKIAIITGYNYFD